MSIRKAVVTGSFYPDNHNEILKYFHIFEQKGKDVKSFDNIRAIIVPHAGYVYSGYTASLAYTLSASKSFKRIILIGPSHKVYLKGVSVSLYDEYETPLGNISMDKYYSENLIQNYDFLSFYEECAFEHSTETQAPFIKRYFKNAKLVEMIYGEVDFSLLSNLINTLLKDEENFIIISTDLSHFYEQNKAKNIDEYCIKGIENKDLTLFEKGEACGKIGVKAVLTSAISLGFDTKVLHYCTSADAFGNTSSVVGYTSVLIGK